MSILDTFSNPSMMHAAVVHMPIAIAMLGVPIAFVCALWSFRTRNKLPGAIALITYLLLAGTAFVGEETGEKARDKVPVTISSEAGEVLTEHETRAEQIKLVAIVTAAFILLTFVPIDGFRNFMWILGLTASVLTAILTTFAAHEGGALVYQYGIGTPYMDIEKEVDGGGEANEEDLIPIRDIDMDAAKLIDFERDIWPMVENYCIDCHEGDTADGDYDMTTIELMTKAGKKAGPGIVPGKPDESSLVLYIRGVYQPRMPKKEPPLSEDELHLFRSWIAAGALSKAATGDTEEEAPAANFDPFGGDSTDSAPAEEAPSPSFDPFGGDSSDAAPAEEKPAEEAAAFDPFG